MADAYVGEIRLFAGNFAPKGWAFCNGQLMSITQHTALYSIFGTIYGGDGRTTFALPDLRGRAPMHQGAGPGLTPRTIGHAGGTSTVTLLENQIPAHQHIPECQTDEEQADPTGAIWADRQSGRFSSVYNSSSPNTPMNPQAIQPAGGSQPHNNMQPYLGLNFIVALQGIFPGRS